MMPNQNDVDTDTLSLATTTNKYSTEADSGELAAAKETHADASNTNTDTDTTAPQTPNVMTPNIIIPNGESSLETSTDNVQQLAELIASISNEDIPSSQQRDGSGIHQTLYDMLLIPNLYRKCQDRGINEREPARKLYQHTSPVAISSSLFAPSSCRIR
jgi:hypothetical protein